MHNFLIHTSARSEPTRAAKRSSTAVPEDPSLLRRYAKVATVTCRKASLQKELSVADPMVIDGLGLTNWLAQLFGPLFLERNRPIWRKSALVIALEEALEQPRALTIVLRHIPPQHQAACEAFVNQAKAAGFFSYYDFRIPLPANIDIQMDSKTELPLRDFAAIAVTRAVTVQQVTADMLPINGYLFIYTHCSLAKHSH